MCAAGSLASDLEPGTRAASLRKGLRHHQPAVAGYCAPAAGRCSGCVRGVCRHTVFAAKWMLRHAVAAAPTVPAAFAGSAQHSAAQCVAPRTASAAPQSSSGRRRQWQRVPCVPPSQVDGPSARITALPAAPLPRFPESAAPLPLSPSPSHHLNPSPSCCSAPHPRAPLPFAPPRPCLPERLHVLLRPLLQLHLSCGGDGDARSGGRRSTGTQPHGLLEVPPSGGSASYLFVVLLTHSPTARLMVSSGCLGVRRRTLYLRSTTSCSPASVQSRASCPILLPHPSSLHLLVCNREFGEGKCSDDEEATRCSL